MLHNASKSGGGDLHCLKYTDDQFEFAPVVEQSLITEFLMDYGVAGHVRPCRITVGYSYERHF